MKTQKNRTHKTIKNKSRDISIDFIRMFAIISVVLIHTTSGYFVNSYETSYFKITLLISSLTSTAVPLFYMISGAFLIKENINFKSVSLKTSKKFLQLMFWSIIYLLIFKYLLNLDINLIIGFLKSIFSSQVSHLWFMYPLIGLYILSPLISKMYYSIDKNGKLYLLIFVFFIPVILESIGVFYQNIISIPNFAIGFPELGLFILGKYIYDKKDLLNERKHIIFSLIGIIIGISAIVALAYFYINNIGISSSKPYFDYNKLPNVLLTSSVYMLLLSSNKLISKLPNKLKKVITVIGENSGGIYFIHMIYIYLFPSIKILNYNFTSNIGALHNMISGAILYFVLSLLSILIIKKIPIFRNTVT